MNREPMPIEGLDALYPPHDRPRPLTRPLIALAAVTALLLLGAGYMLLDEPPAPPPAPPQVKVSDSPQAAPTISGKSEIQLKAELARITQELERAKAERKEVLKAIDQASNELEQKLREANLELEGR